MNFQYLSTIRLVFILCSYYFSKQSKHFNAVFSFAFVLFCNHSLFENLCIYIDIKWFVQEWHTYDASLKFLGDFRFRAAAVLAPVCRRTGRGQRHRPRRDECRPSRGLARGQRRRRRGDRKGEFDAAALTAMRVVSRHSVPPVDRGRPSRRSLVTSVVVRQFRTRTHT